MDTLPIQRATFYVVIGVSPINDTCCVHITNGPQPQSILQPTFDRKYIIDTLFTFAAPKKAPFGVIITNLTMCGIYPKDDPAGFIPARNPDNQYYTSLPKAKISTIKSIVKASICGMCLTLVGDALVPMYTEIQTDPNVLADLMKDSRPRQDLNFNGAIIIDIGGTVPTTKVHYFKLPPVKQSNKNTFLT